MKKGESRREKAERKPETGDRKKVNTSRNKKTLKNTKTTGKKNYERRLGQMQQMTKDNKGTGL